MAKVKKQKIRDVFIENINGDTLQDVIDQVIGAGYKPADFKNIDIEHEEYWEYGNSYDRVEVSIWREETDEEAVERERRMAEAMAARDESERAQYERLKAKFG